MSTTLAEMQFEILPEAEANEGFVFGIGADVSIDDGGFDPGETEWMDQDTRNTRRGTMAFGRDVLGPKTWTWESHTDKDDTEEAAAVLDDFSAAWMPESIVRSPSVVTSIRYRLAGRERRVFGRPRRFSAPPSNRMLSGFVPVTHDFQCVDSFTYDDVESSIQIPYLSTSSGGGMILPDIWPILMASSEGFGAGQVSVGGNARTYPIIRFNGPWVNPVIDTGIWELTWNGSIGPSAWIEIDTRPWRLTVLNQDGASQAGGLSRRTWLEDCWFPPNSQPQINLGGVSTDGSATAIVRWRNAWTSI